MNKETRRRAARIVAAVRFVELADRERMLLGAYLHFVDAHGEPCGLRGVSWPTDLELGAHLGVSQPTIRRARRELERAGVIATERIKPFHKMPDGSTSWHGANVVTVLAQAKAAAPAQAELAGAAADVARLERRLERARAKLEAVAQASDAPTEALIQRRLRSNLLPWPLPSRGSDGAYSNAA